MKKPVRKSIYICSQGWKLYDIWISLPDSKERELAHQNFIDHRNECNMCTPYEEIDENAGI